MMLTYNLYSRYIIIILRERLALDSSKGDSDPRNSVAQTYTIDCLGAVGNMLKITDQDTGNLGHGISEVKIFRGQGKFGRRQRIKNMLNQTQLNRFVIKISIHHNLTGIVRDLTDIFLTPQTPTANQTSAHRTEELLN